MSLVRCLDCGFFEPSKFQDISGTCTENLKHPKKIQVFDKDIDCKKFAERRTGWKTQDFHEWKDRHITNRRTFWISVIALCVSLLTLVFGVIVPLMARVPEVELTFQLLPQSISAPINMTIPINFTLYNSGYKDCFIVSASVYEVFENQSKQDILGIYDLWGTRLGSGETRQVQFDLSYPSEGTIIKQFQIEVYYEPNMYAISQPFWVKWW